MLGARLAAQAASTSSGCDSTTWRDVPTVAADSSMTDTTARRDSVRRAGRSASTNERAAIYLFASASAREVRFAAQPRIRVRLCGAVGDSVRVLERRNLPERVQPGVTYRDVYIAVEIIGHLDATCLARRIGVADSSAVTNADCAGISVRDSTSRRRSPP